MDERVSATHRVAVAFDAEAGVWHTADGTLFGLNAEADTFDELRGKIALYAESILGTRVQIEDGAGSTAIIRPMRQA